MELYPVVVYHLTMCMKEDIFPVWKISKEIIKGESLCVQCNSTLWFDLQFKFTLPHSPCNVDFDWTSLQVLWLSKTYLYTVANIKITKQLTLLIYLTALFSFFQGRSFVFNVALALLKVSRKDLLALDFEGILKYFRVQLPKRFRTEEATSELMQVRSGRYMNYLSLQLKKILLNWENSITFGQSKCILVLAQFPYHCIGLITHKLNPNKWNTKTQLKVPWYHKAM